MRHQELLARQRQLQVVLDRYMYIRKIDRKRHLELLARQRKLQVV